MLRNYLLIAIRNLLRHKVYSAINILGLAVGMGCCVLILLFVNDELSYDQHHEKGDRIYRVLRETHAGGIRSSINETTSGPLANALKQSFPEVERAIWTVFRGDKWFRVKERLIKQSLCLAKPEVLEVFTFSFVAGDPETALDEPFSVVLHASMAKSLFGSEPPLGKTVTIDDNDFRGEYRVTGVVVDPGRATFEFGALISTVPETFARRLDYWVKTANWRSFTTYVLLAEGANARDLEAKLPGLMANTMGESIRTTNTYHLQKLTRVHLYSGQDYGIYGISTGDIGQVYLFIALAGFILLIACINFMNLATARASDRAREVGLRKVVGARRSQLAGQFLGEAMVVAGVACVVSLAITHLALPLLNELSRKDLVLDPMWISALGCFAIFVGLISGSYPAVALSGFRPAAVLRGSVWREPGRAWFREGLVTLQFAVSIGVIAVTVIVHGQLEYLRNKDLGFDKEQIVRLDLFYLESSTPKDPDIPSIKFRYSAVKEAFLRHPNVVAATATRRRQGTEVATGVVRAEGVDGNMPVQVVTADEDYLGFFGIGLESGRNMTRGDIEGLWTFRVSSFGILQ